MKLMIYFSSEFCSHLSHLHFCSWFLFAHVSFARDSAQHVMLILGHKTMKPPADKMALMVWLLQICCVV